MDANYQNRQQSHTDSFNPRARDGREYLYVILMIDLLVSIHAPVMDAKDRLSPPNLKSLFQSTRP